MKLAGRLLLLILLLLFSTHNLLSAADSASITTKSDDGSYLALDDGTKWIISPADRNTASTWVVGDDVVYIDDSNNCKSMEIINKDENGDEVCATQITD